MSFLSNLFGNKSAIAATQAELDAAKAENAELKAALETKPTEVVEYVEVPVMVETLTGVRVQFGSAKNELDSQTYAEQYAGVKTVAELISYMFVDIDTANISSALMTMPDGTTESATLDSVLPKTMPRGIVVNTALGKGAVA
jgi:hypothetical protein